MGGPVLLTKEHHTSSFVCGKEPLDIFLKRHALTNQASDSARTFVVLDGFRVIGYYSLAASSVLYDDAPERMRKGLARHAVPALLMARFAVDEGYQGRGIGLALFKDALKRTLAVSREGAAVRALVVDAKDDEAASFYERLDMIRFTSDSLRLYLLMKDVERTLRPM